ncbi:MAG: HAMP domain-containing histidine kinase [Calditrichae bacterium]|nr:HAMP domain-containing histidine kinase [Calditrichota bacterium]MCB9057094.1 HAMP domain-containing histidine kinase [Calditrichia bacterium]
MQDSDQILQEIRKLKIRIKYLENELVITKQEQNDTTQNYYELYSTLEQKVEERTKELNDALDQINKYNTQLETMLEERTRDLIKTERHAAFSLLSQGIVHNLKNPLSIIHGSTQLINYLKPDLSNENVSPKVSEYLENVNSQVRKLEIGVERMMEMINSLMTKSRSDKSENIEIIEINNLLKGELDFLNADSVFKYKTKKVINLYEGALYTEVVPGELSQIFLNLIRNSLDAMYGQDDAELTFESGIRDEKVWFSVSDNGPGISEENQKKVFDPFFSTKPKASDVASGKPTGTGLGLHMCMQMVHSYKGNIELESKPGKGTAIRVILPKKKIDN